MKKTIFNITAVALLLGFASCSKEQGMSPIIDEGKQTSLKLSLSFPNGPVTRATGDPNATDNEALVNRVDVYIYTGSGNFSSHTSLSASDFTQSTSTSSADVYESISKIPTTTGAKRVYVGINLPSDVASGLVNQPESALANVAQTMTLSALTGATYESFAMFSVQAVASEFVEDEDAPANQIKVECQRLVAKVTVETAANLDTDALPGDVSNLTFAINNFNTKLFMLQGVTPYYKDPNWANANFMASDFIPALAAEYVPVLDRSVISNPTVSQYNPRYAAENTSELKRKKEITRATVRGEFIPSKITTGSAGNFTVINNPSTTAETFYTVTPSVLDGTYFFTNLTAANAFATEKGLNIAEDVITYQDGYSYWHIYLNKNPKSPQTSVNRWDVLRNDFYKCVITKIAGLGRNTPDIEEPETEETPEVDTNITVEIDILFWHTPYVENYILS